MAPLIIPHPYPLGAGLRGNGAERKQRTYVHYIPPGASGVDWDPRGLRQTAPRPVKISRTPPKMWYNVTQMTSKKLRDAIIRARVERIMEAGQQTGESPAHQSDASALEASRATLVASLESPEWADTPKVQIARDAYEVLAQRHALGFESKDD